MRGILQVFFLSLSVCVCSTEKITKLKKKQLICLLYYFVSPVFMFCGILLLFTSLSRADAFKASLGLTLVGPYDILAGKHKKATNPCYLRHWRYYYDPPEFMTVIRGDDKKQFHFGYYRYSLLYFSIRLSNSWVSHDGQK